MEPWRQDAGLGLSGAVQSSPVLAQLSKALSLGKTIDKGGERDRIARKGKPTVDWGVERTINKSPDWGNICPSAPAEILDFGGERRSNHQACLGMTLS